MEFSKVLHYIYAFENWKIHEKGRKEEFRLLKKLKIYVRELKYNIKNIYRWKKFIWTFKKYCQIFHNNFVYKQLLLTLRDFNFQYQKQDGKGVIQFHEKMFRTRIPSSCTTTFTSFPPAVIELFMGFWPFLPKTCTSVRRRQRRPCLALYKKFVPPVGTTGDSVKLKWKP